MESKMESRMESVRIDKWLWAVRIFKTRSLASEACRTGKVKIGGQSVKPSREVKLNDEVSVHMGIFTKTVLVTGLLHNRVSAPLVPSFLTDLTPPEEYEKLKLRHELNAEFRPKGIGRPSKKQRRMIDKLKNFKHF